MAWRGAEDGSALVEAAIVFPCLVLLLYWSAALTDVLVLKLKAAEAVRYALWETIVFKSPSQIEAEIQKRYADLRSARDVASEATGLLLVPRSRDLTWRAALDTSGKVAIGGELRIPAGAGIVGEALQFVTDTLAGSVDAELERERFNVRGKASARVSAARGALSSSRLLAGGDLPGLRGGNDLGRPVALDALVLQAPLPGDRPMQLVFDTWKAWPKPAVYTVNGAPSDPATSPMLTYPEVERQVSAQVEKIAFFGLDRQAWFNRLRSAGNTVSGALGPLAGGVLPDVFSTSRMDGPDRGPITILPPERPDVPWAPHQCEVMGRLEECATQRLGDLRTAGAGPAFLDDTASLGGRVDRTRYTLPYRINTQEWSESGGTNSGDGTGTEPRLSAPPTKLTAGNAHVETWKCRGHFFAGSQRAQEGDPDKRYARSCSR